MASVPPVERKNRPAADGIPRTDISVIVCTKDRPQELRRFLDSLDRQTCLPDEVVIVDGGAGVETREMVLRQAERGPYPLHYLQTRPGLTRQRNQGVRAAAGRYLMFFDDDVVLYPRYVEAARSAFEDRSQGAVDGVMGRIVNSPHQDAITCLFNTLFLLSAQGKGKLKRSGLPSMPSGRLGSQVFIFSGCCMAYSRAVFDRFAFDEKLTGYGYMEDIDFSSRVSREFKLVYHPEAELEHHPTTFRQHDTAALREMMVRHHVYLYRKNMPKTCAHLAAFLWSIFGILAYNTVLSRDPAACRGILRGLSRGDLGASTSESEVL